MSGWIIKGDIPAGHLRRAIQVHVDRHPRADRQ
jgi:hypothetical protein